ncbi:TRAP transporter substrate-binding protein [Alkalilimnicola sp. S0819]|uniref:TRAP transporter substrate-binding protein n=1 Tax=Alkalilimnicola sp. S0819 TaxID=2613922 RepID=UPI0012617FA0|nr:TRAP transporter substrate-binding protein [Alkalilimnicola sp. S0819]KAB7628219.1 TRAP transporter substrate-binding protein [Alkalilimnicola sp. S0819]MPQ15110.1 C4-dicarboxylate ABC transporter [Alkalilimnicola sp. S0819]
MKKSMMSKPLVAAAVGSALLLGAVTEASADRLRWRMPMTFSSNLPALGSPAAWTADRLKEMSGGEIQIRVSEPGKIVPPFEILEAVSEGKVEAGYSWIGYDQGKVPAVPLFAAVPFGLKPWAFTAWYYEGGGHEMLQDVYANKGYNVYANLCGIIGPETAGWYREPIKSLDDYKGLKIRFAGLGGKVLEKLGASVTMMPGGELFQALEKRTIDATEFSLPVIDQLLGFDKVVKNNLYPGWHQTFTAQYILVNKDKWNSASDAQKAMIQTTCQAATLQGLNEGEWLNPDVVAGFKDKGVNAEQLPLSVLKELQDLSNEVLAEEASKDADFKRVYESQQDYAKKYERYFQLGYLPNELYQD